MNTALLQHAIGDDIALLDIASPHHQQYCSLFGITYCHTRTKIRTDDRHPVWEKTAAIRRELATVDDGELVVWLDADAIVTDTNVDLRSVVPLIMAQEQGQGRIGMVRWRGGMLNAGVIYMVVDQRVRDYIDSVDNTGTVPNEYDLKDQATYDLFTRRAEYAGLVVELPSQWNSYTYAKYPPTAPVVVRAWHGASHDIAAAGLKMVANRMRW